MAPPDSEVGKQPLSPELGRIGFGLIQTAWVKEIMRKRREREKRKWRRCESGDVGFI